MEELHGIRQHFRWKLRQIQHKREFKITTNYWKHDMKTCSEGQFWKERQIKCDSLIWSLPSEAGNIFDSTITVFCRVICSNQLNSTTKKCENIIGYPVKNQPVFYPYLRRNTTIKLTFLGASQSSRVPPWCRPTKAPSFHEHKCIFRNTCTLVWRPFYSETRGVFFVTSPSLIWLKTAIFDSIQDVEPLHYKVATKWPFSDKQLGCFRKYMNLIGCCLVTFTPYLAFKL